MVFWNDPFVQILDPVWKILLIRTWKQHYWDFPVCRVAIVHFACNPLEFPDIGTSAYSLLKKSLDAYHSGNFASIPGDDI